MSMEAGYGGFIPGDPDKRKLHEEKAILTAQLAAKDETISKLREVLQRLYDAHRKGELHYAECDFGTARALLAETEVGK